MKNLGCTSYEQYTQTNLIDFLKAQQSLNKAPEDTMNFQNSDYAQLYGSYENSNVGSYASLDINYNADKFQNVKTSVIETTRVNKSIDGDGYRCYNQYHIIDNLGRGSFCKVKLARVEDGTLFAIKIADKNKLNRKLSSKNVTAFSLLQREIAVMKKISHKHVMHLIEVIDDPNADKLYLVMENMSSGALLSKKFFQNQLFSIDYHKNQKDYVLEEVDRSPRLTQILQPDVCRFYFRQFILGLEYLHDYVGVIHRDIKPDNLLVSNRILKIADFGVSEIIKYENASISHHMGTLAFMAPEALTNSSFNGHSIDIWAGGVTLFKMLFGFVPFRSTNNEELRSQIINDKPIYPHKIIIEPELKDLLNRLLDKNPVTRINLKEIKNHSWITNNEKLPLVNSCQTFVGVTDQEISAAITQTNLKIALKVTHNMLSRLQNARRSLKQLKDVKL